MVVAGRKLHHYRTFASHPASARVHGSDFLETAKKKGRGKTKAKLSLGGQEGGDPDPSQTHTYVLLDPFFATTILQAKHPTKPLCRYSMFRTMKHDFSTNLPAKVHLSGSR